MGDDTLAKLWPKAVSSIKRDSRLRTELKTVNGEEGEYWAWIDSSIKAHDEKTTRVAALGNHKILDSLLKIPFSGVLKNQKPLNTEGPQQR